MTNTTYFLTRTVIAVFILNFLGFLYGYFNYTTPSCCNIKQPLKNGLSNIFH